MAEPKIRDRLVGGWRLTGYEVTAGGKTGQPLGDDPLGMILYPPDGYMPPGWPGRAPTKMTTSGTPATSRMRGRTTWT